MICCGDLRVTMTRDFDLRFSQRRLSVAGIYLRGHLRQSLQCRLICSTSHSILIASRLFLSCFPAMRSIASEFTIASMRATAATTSATWPMEPST